MSETYPNVKCPKGYWEPVPGLYRSVKVPHPAIEECPKEFVWIAVRELTLCQNRGLKAFFRRLTKGE